MPSRVSHIGQLPGRPVATVARPVANGTVCVFHFPSDFALVTGLSDEHPVEFNGFAFQAWAHLTNVGGATTAGNIRWNGAIIGSFAISGGNKDAVIALSQDVSADELDYFTVELTAIGTSCSATPSGLWVGVFLQ